ncbi:MAG TPA: SRPBCC family protein [Steroidobacteraceae bacterium]|jgi:uncharacterized protein YndB with AHSA1/START domain|nr:SRPBCC family protein [Steroidobacteraceae bacterium]
MKLLRVLFVFCALVAVYPHAMAADFPNVRDDSYVEPNGSRVLKLSITIDAPVSTIWKLLSSSEGWQSWAVPVAWVEFGVGGMVETSYTATAVRGQPGNIKNSIVAYVPEQLLVLRNVQAPPNFENAEDFGKTVTAINLRSISKNRAQVELDGVGFLATPAFDTLLKKFKYGDSWTLEHLKRAAEHGPINWAEEARSDPPKQSK